jgi:hypothetical protein
VWNVIFPFSETAPFIIQNVGNLGLYVKEFFPNT